MAEVASDVVTGTPTVSPETGQEDVKRVRGPNYPLPTDTDATKDAYINQLYQEGETDALARYRQATQHILYANGRQWIAWVKSRKSWDDMPIAERDVRVTNNYIIVMLRARVQRLVSSEINWRGIPESNSFEARDRVKVAINFIKSRWLGLEMEHKLRQALMQAQMTGVAAFKSFWNPSIGPLTPATMIFDEPQFDELGQPLFDEMGMPVTQQVERYVDANQQPVENVDDAFFYRPGDTDTAIRTVFNLRLNPEATGWTEAEGFRWLIDEEIVPIAVAREAFPQIADKIRVSENMGSAMTYERMVRGSSVAQALGQRYRQPYAGATQSSMQEMTAIREYWEARSRFFPRGRLIISVGGAIAYDGPWPDDVFPYAPFFGEPAIMAPYGRSPVVDMISPQDVINREMTAIVKEMIASGSGKFVAWDIPGLPDQVAATDETVVRVPMRTMLANRDISSVIRRMDPASAPSDRWRLIDQAKATLFDIGAYHEVSRGQIPPGLDSGVAIQYLLEQESAQLKDAVEAVRRSMVLWARHQLAIARKRYDTERWIPVDRPDLGYMIESITGIQLPDPETIGLDIESFRPQSEAAVRNEVKELMSAGLIDPRRGLRIMDLGAGFDEAFDSQTRHYAKAQRENLAFERLEVVFAPNVELGKIDITMKEDGSPLLLPEDDDHLIHIDVHQEIALDTSQPWELRQVVLMHIAEHRQAMMMQQAMLAAATAPAEGEGSTNNQEP